MKKITVLIDKDIATDHLKSEKKLQLSFLDTFLCLAICLKQIIFLDIYPEGIISANTVDSFGPQIHNRHGDSSGSRGLYKHHPYHMLSTAVRISAEYFTYGIEVVRFGGGRQAGPSVD